MREEKGEEAISQAMGVILMVVITVILAMVVTAIMMGVVFPDKFISATFRVTAVNNTTLMITHAGGESLRISETNILIDGVGHGTTGLIDGNGNGLWDPGEVMAIGGLSLDNTSTVTITSEQTVLLTQDIQYGSSGAATPAPTATATPTPSPTPVPSLADFLGAPLTGSSPLAVSFVDKSTGSISAWNWSFGDGQYDNAQNPTHTYAVDGSYTVTLNVTGPGGNSTMKKYNYVVVSTLPAVADFIVYPKTGDAPLSILYTDMSSGHPTSWLWDFGDGFTSNTAWGFHTYTLPGTYTISLTVTPGSSTKMDTVTVTSPSVTPTPTVTPTPIPPSNPNIVATYYDNMDWSSVVATVQYPEIRLANDAGVTDDHYASDVAGWPRAEVGRDQYFSASFDGYLKIDTDDDYTFYLTSDDGSYLWVDGNLVVDNGGIHNATETASVPIHLAPGYHQVTVKMFQRDRAAVLYLMYEAPIATGGAKVFANNFWHY